MSIGQLTKNINIDEFRCNDKNRTPVPEMYLENAQELANNLQVLRDELNTPITPNSAYRTPYYNDVTLRERGYKTVKNSYHKKAMAWDIVAKGYTAKEVYETILSLIEEGKMKNGGVGLYNTFVHYDIREYPARW